MTDPTSPESLVERFVTSPRQSTQCQTCNHGRAEDINRALTKFAELRDAGQTTFTWTDLYRNVLREQFGYTLSVDALRAHVRNCLEIYS